MDREHLLAALARLIPADRLLTRPGALAAYESDGLTAYRARPCAVVLAESADEIIEIVRACHAARVPFMARGSGTSLSGGAVPVEDGIVIALNRMNRVLRLDPDARVAVVEPGVVNLAVTALAAPHGLYYAPDPSSQSVCTIGGNVAFNSGGAHCFRHGMTANHVLGLRVVLGDGTVAALGGDSLEQAGADLGALFVGSEGLFGIALEITLRLVARPAVYRTVLAAYRSLQAAGDAVSRVIESGLLPGAMEIMDRLAMDAAEAAVQAGYPTDAAAVLIVELEGEDAQVAAEFERLMRILSVSGAAHTRIAADDEERARIWKGRKCAFSAVGRLSPDFIVQDGVVPRARLGEALAAIEALSRAHRIRVANVFHAGDGNLHPLILYDGREAGAHDRAEVLAAEILRLCIRLGGSITGEHGVGLEKRAFLGEMYTEADLACMRRVREAMDPHGVANTGKKLAPAAGATASHGLHPLERAGVIFAGMTVRPTSLAALEAMVPAHPRLRLRGGGTKGALSGPLPGAATLDLSSLAGMVEYTPEECTFTALAGTRIAEIEGVLAAHGQYLPFDPPLAAAGATLGGTVAAGLNGSCRYRYGGIRDFIIGARIVDGRGRLTQSGGKVVKNAAGFLLHQALVGSCGTLGILAELTFKVFPAAEAHATLRVERADLASALALVATVQRARFDLEAVDLDPPRTLWLRLGGLQEALATRTAALQRVVGRDAEVSTGKDDDAVWRDARELAWAPAGRAIVRVPITLPTLAPLDAAVAHEGAVRRYTVAGNLALIAWAGPLDVLSDILRDRALTGQVLVGPAGRPFIGAVTPNAFEERLRGVMDPDGRFG